ncbi:uncharacterized protein LOC135169778 [Diachasmimorpha longicaudata]|uniref:uncharacterized protein LOC135169778 n=1 Tax=Diachasmimorpha longicaudata TaxID=58733 RepID=UPI0030B8E7E8
MKGLTQRQGPFVLWVVHVLGCLGHKRLKCFRIPGLLVNFWHKSFKEKPNPVPNPNPKRLYQKKFYCQFHSGCTYNERKLAISLLKNRDPAPKTWKKYPVTIRGGANSYEEAETRLKELRHHPYEFTSEDDVYRDTQIEALRKRLITKKVISDDKVAELFEEACQSTGSLTDSEHERSSPEIEKRKRRAPRRIMCNSRRSRSLSPFGQKNRLQKNTMDSTKDIQRIGDSSPLKVVSKHGNPPQVVDSESESHSPSQQGYLSRGKIGQRSLNLEKDTQEPTDKIQKKFRTFSLVTTTPSKQKLGSENVFHNDVRKEFRDIKLAIGPI